MRRGERVAERQLQSLPFCFSHLLLFWPSPAALPAGYRAGPTCASSTSRLSCSLRPLHRPRRSFARPSVKYILNGISVSPFSFALAANFLISRRCISSLRGRLGT